MNYEVILSGAALQRVRAAGSCVVREVFSLVTFFKLVFIYFMSTRAQKVAEVVEESYKQNMK